MPGIIAPLVAAVQAYGGLNGLLTLNGPSYPSNNVEFAKKKIGDFVHPGLWHTHDDLERIRNGILQKQQPWYNVWQNFSSDPLSQSDVSLTTLHAPATPE